MTLGLKVQSKLVVLHNDRITEPYNCDISGSATGTIAAMLLDPAISNCFIAGTGLYEPLAGLNSIMQASVPGWRMRVSNRRRQAITYKGERRIIGRFFVDYIALDQRRNKDEREPRRRFDIINLELFKDHPSENPEDQQRMALAILAMCESRGVNFKGTRGSLANVMLKASLHWEEGRHAAPQFINDKARTQLPGNFYSVSNKVKKAHPLGVVKSAYYIDQNSAHHTIAKTISLPHPHYLRARGNYKRSLQRDYIRWCDPNSVIGQQILNGEHIGLVCCRLNISTIGPSIEHLYPTWAQKRGKHHIWLWTSELRLILEDHRIQLECFIAAFTTTIADPVLPEYATWALTEIACNSEPSSIKSTLLSAYGILAFNSKSAPLYRYWGGINKKDKVELPLAGQMGETKLQLPENVQMSTVNVIARGLIEAETRTRSIEYARELHNHGYHVAQIYADGLLVEAEQLPFIRHGWRISHELSNVYIPRVNAFVSDSLVKLPGVSGGAKGSWQDTRRDARRILLTDTRAPANTIQT